MNRDVEVNHYIVGLQLELDHWLYRVSGRAV